MKKIFILIIFTCCILYDKHLDEKVFRFIVAKHGEDSAIDLDDIRDALSDNSDN